MFQFGYKLLESVMTELPLEVACDRETDAFAVELHTVELFSSPYPV